MRKLITSTTIIGLMAGVAATALLLPDDNAITGSLKTALKSLSGQRPASAVVAQRDVPVPARTAAVIVSDFPVRARAVGTIEAAEIVNVRSRIDSQVMEWRVVEGQLVKAGDLLLVLDDKELRAQASKDEANLKRDLALHARLMADRARKEDLASRGHASQMALDQVRADEQAAAATLKASEATLEASRQRLSQTRIHAPIAGRLGMLQVTSGNLVSAGSTAIVTITRMDQVRVAFALPERDLGLVRTAIERRRATVRAFASGQEVPVATGMATYLEPTVHTASGTVTVGARFDNQNGALWPGQHVAIELDLDVRSGVSTVPTVAVQHGHEGAYALVVGPDNRLELRKVTIAAADGAVIALAAGLAAGERVVIDGHFKLRPGMLVEDMGDAIAGRDRPTPLRDAATTTQEKRT